MNKDYTQQNREHAGRMFDELETLQLDPRMTSQDECTAHCPFHDDETPSFSLNMERGVFYCHACGVKGTYWDFNALRKRKGYCDLSPRLKEPPMKKEHKMERQKIFRIVDRYNRNATPLNVDKATIAQCIEDIINYWHGYLLNSRQVRMMVTEEYEKVFTRSYHHWNTGRKVTNTNTYISPKFTMDTVRAFKIGFSPDTSVELTRKLKKKYTKDEMIGTGLLRKHGDFGLITPYSGRVVYPYLREGKPCYSIARITSLSPNNLSDCKYLKQRTRDREHTFPFQNPPLFNSDVIRLGSNVLITEGITDAIKACEAGIAAVSPVTIAFMNRHLDLIAEMLRDKQVGICNDNERNGSGERGMKIMLAELEKRGIQVQGVTLPRRPEQEKVDVCSFINEMGAEAFHQIIEQQTGFDFRPKP